MAWHRASDKPLPQRMVTTLTDASLGLGELCFKNMGWGCVVGVFGWVSDSDGHHRPLTLNVTKGQKGGSKLYILPFLYKYGGRNTTFSSCLPKYRGRNYANFPET